MRHLTLVSHPTCPFVQRAIIALKEKGVPFDVQYVDLMNRPDWFTALSPLGKVPVLKVELPGRPEAVLFESTVIVEYIEETTDGPKLHPADPLERAKHRAWMEFGSTMLADLLRYASAADAGESDAARATLLQKFARLENELGDGPFFGGQAFSAVDAVFGPVFRQVDVLDSATGAPLLLQFPKADAWRHALAARPSVRDAAPPDYRDRYLGRLRSIGSHVAGLAG